MGLQANLRHIYPLWKFRTGHCRSYSEAGKGQWCLNYPGRWNGARHIKFRQCGRRGEADRGARRHTWHLCRDLRE